MEFALLASGSKGNCFVLRDGGTSVMIDCGTTKRYLFENLAKAGFVKEELDALLITHDHSDHISQIRHFSDLPVYSPVEIEGVDVFRVRPLQSFAIEALRITPVALSHDAPNTTGYVIENGLQKLVYITDTGYVNERYMNMLTGADYIVMESNHDVRMLMGTRRPQYLKARIYSDQGHLCNEDCAAVLDRIVTENTKMIILAHLSQEANTRELALQVSREALHRHEGKLSRGLMLCAAGQYEMIRKGNADEEMDCGTVYCAAGMEHLADGASV